MIIVKYYNQRMITTVDVNCLIETLLNAFNSNTEILFSPMNQEERKSASNREREIIAVTDRFRVFEDYICEYNRRRDIEDIVIKKGRK